uniref:Uncharacterized protein n=1 Tax=Lactuca sativa TaxID=4236 RepID=A0A9R1UL00_LACSA|nr:hypothetical protein LSAT_V11C800403780 [Lactuca sativa]
MAPKITHKAPRVKLHLPSVSGIRVSLSESTLKEGISWSIKCLITLFMFIITCVYKIDHKECYDPIDYESIDKIEFWVVDEIPEGELSYTELENMDEDEPPNYNESTMFESQVSEDDEEDDDGVALQQIDMDSFR